jgi:hypothetical protein
MAYGEWDTHCAQRDSLRAEGEELDKSRAAQPSVPIGTFT